MSQIRVGLRAKLRRILTTAGWAVGTVTAAVGLLVRLLEDASLLWREDGILELTSVVCWSATLILSAWAALRGPGGEDRLAVAWLAVLALVAGLREMDAHVWLNPGGLGEFGVHYRIDWWLDGQVPLALRLGWGLFFFGLTAVLVYPPLRLWRRTYRLLRAGDFALSLLMLGLAFLALGFVLDDLARNSTWMEAGVRTACEETSELIGAVLVFLAALSQFRLLVLRPPAGAAEAV